MQRKYEMSVVAGGRTIADCPINFGNSSIAKGPRPSDCLNCNFFGGFVNNGWSTGSVSTLEGVHCLKGNDE